jgi:uncharacterized protein (TIGR02246 family)
VSDALVQRVADELEIRNLVARVAHLSDTGELDEYRDIYTDDAVWTERAGPQASFPAARGYDEIMAGVRDRRAAGIQGPGSNTQHVVNTITVRFSGPDEAVVRAYWQYYGNLDTKPALLRVGTYDYLVRRTAGGWRFQERVLGSLATGAG